MNPRSKTQPLFTVNDAINDNVSFWMRGDSFCLKVDAIVNSANSDLSPGDGICGVLHAAAGPELEAACSKVGLPAKYIIHAVGPLGECESALVSAYESTLVYLDGTQIKRGNAHRLQNRPRVSR